MVQKDYPVKDYTRDNQRSIEEERGSKSSKDFVVGAIIGSIVGAATALFMAPKPGKELRNDLNVQAKSLTEKTEKLRQTAMEKGSDLMEKGSGLAETAMEKTKPVADIVTTKSTDILNKVKGLKQSQEDPNVKNTGNDTSDLGDSDGSTGYNKAPVAAVEVKTDTNTGNTTTTGNANAAKLKLDETKKAFDETENKYKK
ncbi:YtxH domain-containing protein [Peribacillus sp. FSL H8-0477]|uniref:YtxH domain-containing protein n=1 Tax=Peribacillus sp. FSL H8-0477 TaxID=2921388 RepID=UPI0030F9F233